MIKDFYHWAGSQCRHAYTSHWDHGPGRCPNLVDAYNHPSRTIVKFGKGFEYYESILDLWNKYYEEWEEQAFPHLMTRYEDLLFHGEEVTRSACECVGGEFATNFAYVEGMPFLKRIPLSRIPFVWVCPYLKILGRYRATRTNCGIGMGPYSFFSKA